jgi:hypothetical protein
MPVIASASDNANDSDSDVQFQLFGLIGLTGKVTFKYAVMG